MTYGSRGLVGGALSRSWRHVPRTVREVTADGPPDLEKNLPEPGGTESG